MDTDSQQAPGEIQNLLQNIESEIARFQSLVTNEDDKMLRYKVSIRELWVTCEMSTRTFMSDSFIKTRLNRSIKLEKVR